METRDWLVLLPASIANSILEFVYIGQRLSPEMQARSCR